MTELTKIMYNNIGSFDVARLEEYADKFNQKYATANVDVREDLIREMRLDVKDFTGTYMRAKLGEEHSDEQITETYWTLARLCKDGIESLSPLVAPFDKKFFMKKDKEINERVKIDVANIPSDARNPSYEELKIYRKHALRVSAEMDEDTYGLVLNNWASILRNRLIGIGGSEPNSTKILRAVGYEPYRDAEGNRHNVREE
jgi:hypothetical protein